MSESRRSFFRNATVLGAGLMGWAESLRAQKSPAAGAKGANQPPNKTARKRSSGPPMRMQSPDIPDLPFTLEGETKVFRLIAEPVKRRIVPWKTLDVWGYNGSCPGPTIQVTQGDRVRILVENRLPESTSMHWHGIEVPIDHEERAIQPVAGRISIAGRTIEPGSMLVLRAGQPVTIEALEDARLMLLGGAPLDGPRHMWWNFVSSSPERIEQAKADWKAGRFGQVPSETEFIPLPE